MDKSYFKEKNIKIEGNRGYEIDGTSVRGYKLNTSVFEFEKEIAGLRVERPYKTKFEKEKTMRAALENVEIPYIVYVVYRYFLRNGKYPTLDQLVAEYLSVYCDKINKGLYRFKAEFDVEGDPIIRTKDIQGRLYRSFFSYIREIHLLYSLMEYKDLEVSYDMRVDIVEGLDIIVKHNNQTVYLRSYLNSKNSNYWKNTKDTNKHAKDYCGKKILNVPACMIDDFENGKHKNTKKVGSAEVHTEQYIREVHDEILKLCSGVSAAVS